MPEVTGPARIGTIRELTSRARAGDILVIDETDLRIGEAEALVALSPAALVNARRTATGRQPAQGARVLIDAGIVVVDGAGPAVLAVRDGSELSILGGVVTRGGSRIADGTLLTADQVVAADTAALDHLKVQVAVFGSHALERLERDGAVFFEGRGLPALGNAADGGNANDVHGRVVLVVAAGDTAAEDLRSLKRFIRERRPLVIAEGGAVDACRAANVTPAVIVGGIEDAPDDALTAAHVIVTEDDAATRARLEMLSVPHEVSDAHLAGADLATLAAHHGDAEVVVVAGRRHSAVDVLSADPETGIGSFLVALVTARSSVDARVVAATYRHRHSAWFVWTVLALSVGLLAVAVWSAADARDLLQQVWDTLTGGA